MVVMIWGCCSRGDVDGECDRTIMTNILTGSL
jgi:hypothetical protein